MYCSETCAQTKAKSNFFKNADMKALRRIAGGTHEDIVTIEAGLVDLYKLQVLSRLPQFGDVHRRENDSAQKSTDMFQSQGKDHQKAEKC